MKYLILSICATLMLISCQNSKFEKEFECETPISYTQTKTYKDVLKHFEIDVPSNWKSELYYDEYQSALYTADTTKALRETYILDIAWHQGELVLNKEFEVRVAQNASRNLKLVPVRSGFGEYLGHPAYYHIATGKSEDLSWHYLEIYVQHKVDEYYTFTSKIYGNEFVSERICASFSVFNEITFLE
jgi:hypothetical protein